MNVEFSEREKLIAASYIVCYSRPITLHTEVSPAFMDLNKTDPMASRLVGTICEIVFGKDGEDELHRYCDEIGDYLNKMADASLRSVLKESVDSIFRGAI